MKAVDDFIPMTRRDWYIMLMTCDTRYLPSRCCGRTIYYRYHGDEYCDEHRCTTITSHGERCSNRATAGDICGQHFGIELRSVLAG